MQYNDVIKFLNEYSTKEPPYDPNGAIHLLKATIENLQEYFMDYDFEQYSACLDEENEKFLEKLLKFIPISRKINNSQEEEFEEQIKLREIGAIEFIEQLSGSDEKEISNLIEGKYELEVVKYLKSKYGLNLGVALEVISLIKKKTDESRVGKGEFHP